MFFVTPTHFSLICEQPVKFLYYFSKIYSKSVVKPSNKISEKKPGFCYSYINLAFLHFFLEKDTFFGIRNIFWKRKLLC